MPKIKVNGTEVEAPPGMRLLEVLTNLGTDVPHYCWHPGLTPAGNCRMCLVKVSNSRKLEVACMVMPSEGLEVTTEGEEIDAARKSVLEYMLINHPLDCPICDKAGECRLQDYTYEYRHGLSRFKEDKVIRPTKDLGPNIKIWGNRCISCTRCVRFCDEIAGTGELSIVNRGDHSVADTHPEVPLDNPMSLNVVDICPVGALIDKNFLYQARVWFAERKDSVCTSCSRGCNVVATVYKNEIKRLQPRFNADVNGHWMCDHGRLNIAQVASERRLKQAKGTVQDLARALREGGNKSAVIVSSSHTLEELYLLRQLANAVQAKVAVLGRDVGTRWVSKSGFAIEPDKTSNRRGAELLFGGGAGGRPTTLGSVVQLARSIWDGQVKTLFVSNQLPDLEWPEELVAAAPKLQSLAVADLLDGPLVARADVVVPTVCWAEKDGTIMNLDGRIQRLRPLVAPPQGARTELAFLQELLVELGVRRHVVSAEAVFREAFPGLDYARVGLLGTVPGASTTPPAGTAPHVGNK
ncbi:MAG: 2Fe-2S iron-sulfur cluster-binding protein [Myxococcota bacterium]